jgi:hypothetical protein
MVIDAFRGVAVHAKLAGGRHLLAIDVLPRRQWMAAGWAGALNAEQVVILSGQLALAPARFDDRLGDGDRRRDSVLSLRRRRPVRDPGNEGLLRVLAGWWGGRR